MKNPSRNKGIILDSEARAVWICDHLHGTPAQAKRCASRQRDRMFKVSSKNVLAHDKERATA